MDEFQVKAQKDFIEHMTKLVTMLRDRFPECEASSDMLTYVTGVVVGSATKENDVVQKWMAQLQSPLQKVKYGRSVERITKMWPTVYHGCKYRDVEALRGALTSGIFSEIDLYTKVTGSTLTDADKERFWKHLDKLNACAYEVCGVEAPPVPSKVDIKEEIKRSRGTEPSSVLTSFADAVKRLCSHCEAPASCVASDAGAKKTMAEWAEALRATTNGKNIKAACSERDVEAYQALRSRVPVSLPESCTEAVWDLLLEVNNFAIVGSSINPNMMTRIEDFASKLADDMAAGRVSNLDMNSIGSQVLAGCDKEDMDHFAANIDSILPAALAQLKR